MSKANPLIITFGARSANTENIMTQVEAAGYRSQIISDITQLVVSSRDEATSNKPGEPVYGREADVFAAVVDLQPVMIIWDLTHAETPWQKWIPIIKASPATRRISIIGFAALMSGALRKQARNHGAEIAVAEEKFMQDLPKIIKKFSRVVSADVLSAGCAEPLSKDAIKGLELFNTGEYFECHEALEDAWNADSGPVRELYRGVLQVGVAYLQIERGNYNGAIKMLMRVRQWLDPLPDQCRGIDVAQLRHDAQHVYDTLQEIGRENIADFDQSLFKPVKYTRN